MTHANLDGAVLISVDWGTTNVRVMRTDDSGGILEQRADPRGAGRLAPDDFPVVLRAIAGDWLGEGLPVMICGMAGARDRWAEVPYVQCPAGLEEITSGLVTPGGLDRVQIVPGVSLVSDRRLMDVMRGEEAQILGTFEQGSDATAIRPGTHSKWARVQGGRISTFRTFMTGELFAAIRQGTVLGSGMGEPGRDNDAFLTGVDRSLNDRATTAALFSVRIDKLDGRLAEASTAEYLSGLLIGAEIAAQVEAGVALDEGLVLIGADALSRRYNTALTHAGFTALCTVNGADVAARGLWRIWKANRS